MADRHMHYGHVVPNVNLFLLKRDDIIDRLVQNNANPSLLGVDDNQTLILGNVEGRALIKAIVTVVLFFSLNYQIIVRISFEGQLRNRPRGLGLLRLPTGMTDERSGPFFPNLYIAGNKAGQKPQTVPDIHLPGQEAQFTGKSAFNPFTHAVSAVYTEDLVDGWGTGFAVHGVNMHALNVRDNYHRLSDVVLGRNDASHQPFILGFTVGAEYDLSKIREVSGHLDLPVPGVNEMFDLDGSVMLKGFGNGVFNGHLDFPLTLSDPGERFPFSLKYLNFMADRHMHYGHVIPNLNLFLLRRSDIMDRLVQNKANPTSLG
ncbi:unnamed protein product [Enterobius vermicularis]|uniref:TonB_dep_Rec domain-containing protein n=1 Tax=Enterobius vermicularis TaxID=51028 RepID=A0A0N4UVK1_ENTVE|nr:unnamed protein product [Enterobius vermicularis]